MFVAGEDTVVEVEGFGGFMEGHLRRAALNFLGHAVVVGRGGSCCGVQWSDKPDPTRTAVWLMVAHLLTTLGARRETRR